MLNCLLNHVCLLIQGRWRKGSLSLRRLVCSHNVILPNPAIFESFAMLICGGLRGGAGDPTIDWAKHR